MVMEKVLSYVPSGQHKYKIFVLISIAAVIFYPILYMSESNAVYLNAEHAYHWAMGVDGHVNSDRLVMAPITNLSRFLFGNCLTGAHPPETCGMLNKSASNLINIRGYYLTKDRFTSTYALGAPSSANMTLTLKIINEILHVARTEMIQFFEEYRTLALNFTKSSGVKNGVLLLNERLDMNYSKKIDRIRHVISLNVYWNTTSNARADVKVNSLNSQDALVDTYRDWSVSPGTCQGPHGKISDCLTRQTKSTVIRDDPEPEPWQPTFLHIIPNAAVHKDGNVRTSHIQFAPYGCKSKLIKKPIEFKATALFQEVFVIAHYWGGGFFHMAIEGLPRLVPYLQFLRQHQHIKIHLLTKVSSKVAYERYFKMLDINPDRIVTGHVRANIVYLPKGGLCGAIVEPHGQIFSREMRSFIATQFPRETAESVRRTLVLIRRSRSRRLQCCTQDWKIVG